MDKYFQCVTINSNLFVNFDIFVSFLKKNHVTNYKNLNIRVYNVVRTLKGYKADLKDLEGKTFIPNE